MKSRTRRKWSPDSRGYYTRQIGWVLSKNGKKQQQKFLLGKDLREAECRERKLRELWDRYASSHEQDQPLWPDDLLRIGKCVSRGVEEVAVEPRSHESQLGYADRIRRLQATHPVVLFVPSDRYFYDVGCAAIHCLEQVPAGSVMNQATVKGQHRRNGPRTPLGEIEPATSSQVSFSANHRVSFEAPRYGVINTSPSVQTNNTSNSNQVGLTPANLNRQTLHEAFSGYQGFIKREYYRPELDRLTDWGHTQNKQVELLKEHHDNRLLAYVDADAVNEMLGYWRRRPPRKGTNSPMKAKSASNYLSALVRFFKWLHSSSTFEWAKPFAFSDANTRVQSLPSDHANRQLEQVETFSLQELQLLMQYAQPLDRLFLLLAINCGFGRAEISSLLIREVKLFEAHSDWHCELLNYKSTDEDSFIKRVRRKSGVYGEHILYPLTVKGIQWAIEERKKHSRFFRRRPSAAQQKRETIRPSNKER